ncbi:calcium/sodium antiporter [Moritella sp. F3]|uniref:calcium/sodium antiporter n=1 Tax=Moritella sp. F3 TaxID=2718882 RepID=UPI0018E0F9A2|nr:calcium/sodium antiporter [Moritella sp. F3]GIC76113.1 sodium:calcium antiporter [Moritella sp. F1]GIC82784.1 sodium:calcium antiporter [Moritella sp. F3]
MLTTNIIILILGLIGLVISADKFVYGAAGLARNLGISPLIIGLTIVAMGSSAPEMMVAVSASLNGAPNTAIGNAIGSNITNITLVLGLTALLKPLLVGSATIRREIPMVLITTILAGVVLWDLKLEMYEGVILLLLFFITILTLTILALKRPSDDPIADEHNDDVPEGVPTWKAVAWLIFGMIALPVSSSYLVDSAVVIAQYYGMSDLVIGLTIIAIGTSLPELAASITGVLKGEDDLAMGNIIGSNIFNILAVLSLPGILAPGMIDPAIISRDFYYMLGATIVMLLMAIGFRGRPGRINRIEGGVLLAGFVAYQVIIFSSI